ncbi:MAG TPA: ribosome rescue protein RqcH [Thermoplasmata archaeon]|nr:ribosome rescue protein RqcH [Thermoplasmata archaeon]
MPGLPTPKDRFTALDTLAVVRELRARARPRVDKAFDLPQGGWSVVLRVPGEGRLELLLVPGRYAALLPFGAERTEELSPFARELRRLLSGAVLERVTEPAGERYLELGLTRGDAEGGLRLLLELFGTGNLAVAVGEKIVAVAHTRRWAHRSVRVGAEYARPPSKADPWSMSPEGIEEVLERSRTDLTSTLAARLGLGGPLAEEVVARLGGDGTSPASVEAGHRAAALHDALARLLDELGEKPVGHLYLREGVVVDATPYRSVRWTDVDGVVEEARPTFSEAAHEFFRTVVPAAPTAEVTQALAERREVERMLAQQRAAVEALEGEVAELRTDAETILAHYAEAEEAVAKARAAGAKEEPVQLDLGGRSVRLHPRRSARESAQELFEESKRRAAKLAGARAALTETEARAAAPLSGGAAGAPSARVTPPRKVLWFEKFRWFISSEGAVVIAGRDAASNDLVVRRNLKDGDVYLHADLHGAASVIVKRPPPGGPEVTEVTLREAGQWAVAFSKAWRAGLASASAFWVNPDQVSKSAASGEFVPRGAWVVHGTKHFLKDLPLELALGTVRYEKEERWTAAPESAVRARGTVRILLVPGEDRDRAAVEVDLARELGVSRSVLQSLLPAGGLSVRRA